MRTFRLLYSRLGLNRHLQLVLAITLVSGMLAAFPALQSAAATNETLHGKVIAITDGDTIQVLVDREPVKVRLWGIDAPEHDQAFGTRSQQALAASVFGKVVDVEVRGRDRYGRTLGVIRSGPSNANLEQVRTGMAWWYQKYAPKAAEYSNAETAARQARRGLWADTDPTPPWEFRRDKRGRSR